MFLHLCLFFFHCIFLLFAHNKNKHKKLIFFDVCLTALLCPLSLISSSPSTSGSPGFLLDTPDTLDASTAVSNPILREETAIEGQRLDPEEEEDSQIYRHFLLLILLAISMFFVSWLCPSQTIQGSIHYGECCLQNVKVCKSFIITGVNAFTGT
ncbi:unnamed protein product [Dibothriocephalus latus]|uniref:Uncharacterized protein n=1 Tax=Dibothriocephalus latus TaxID=60516 RepID=A0A3P7RMY8_DIBLA|nr:unnamed protein product [Dibothriocephalus latus]